MIFTDSFLRTSYDEFLGSELSEHVMEELRLSLYDIERIRSQVAPICRTSPWSHAARDEVLQRIYQDVTAQYQMYNDCSARYDAAMEEQRRSK